MKLTAIERVLLLGFLPVKGHDHELVRIKSASEELGLNDKELVIYEDCKLPGDRVDVKTLNETIGEKDISLGEWLTDKIKSDLDKLERDGELPIGQHSLWHKFVKNMEEAEQISKKREKAPL